MTVPSPVPPSVLDDPRGFTPKPTHRIFRDALLPRLIVPLAWIYALALLPAWLLGREQRRRNSDRPSKVAVESGRVGWTQVFFEELAGSAQDYFGEGNVHRAAIDRDLDYGPQFDRWMDDIDPTHAIIDVRTPPQSWPASLVQALKVSWTLHRRGVYPIVILTDAFYRRQRWHAAVLTAWSGMVMTYAARDLVRGIFPHRRIRGPEIMTISKARRSQLASRIEFDSERSGSDCVIAFVGNIYPPRSDFLAALADELTRRGLTLSINGDKNNRSNEDYWATLADADVVVTTTMQGPDRNYIDWNWVRQAVHRYSETFAAGTALVAAPVDGGFPCFEADRDYQEFGSVLQAADIIEQLANDPHHRNEMARRGHETYSRLMDGGAFWKTALGQE